jgi:hypothetical protein
MRTTRIALLAAAAVAAAAATAGTGTAAADPARTVTFTNQLDVMTPVDVAPTGPSAGDQFYIDSHIVSGDGTGRTAAACVLAKPHGGGLRLCEIDIMLSNGTITMRGIVPGLAPTTPVRLVVTGGSGAFFGVSGAGTLTPTPDGSAVRLRLR